MKIDRLIEIGESARVGVQFQRTAFVLESVGMLVFALGVALGIPFLVWGMLTLTLLSVTLYVWGVKTSASARQRFNELLREARASQE